MEDNSVNRSFTSLVIALVLSVTASASQGAAGAADSKRRQDIYAVYSAMFANPDSNDKVYLFEKKTFAVQPDLPSTLEDIFSLTSENCFHIPPAYETAWKEILNETRTQKDSPGTIAAELKIKTPYVLLNVDEVQEFADAIESERGPQNPKFHGRRSLIRLGDVYFNKTRTLALTSIGTVCGSLCGSGGDLILEKSANGKWKERPDWVGCHWVS
jgi:hypothetical protein